MPLQRLIQTEVSNSDSVSIFSAIKRSDYIVCDIDDRYLLAAIRLTSIAAIRKSRYSIISANFILVLLTSMVY